MYLLNDTLTREFPHSEIPGSKLICSSPRLIAACHVLHRLLMPRHSPYALFRLNFLLYSLFSELLEFLLKQDIVFALKRFFLFVSLSTFRWNCNCLNLLRRYPFWKDSINFSILSSFICSFFNSFKSKYLNFSFTYSIVKFHVCDFSHCPCRLGFLIWRTPYRFTVVRRFSV